MSNIPDREAKIVHLRGQMEVAKLYAEWWIASATTGEVLSHALQRGTDDRKQYPSGWRDLTNAEKICEALDTSKVHIQRYGNMNDMMLALVKDDAEAWEREVNRS